MGPADPTIGVIWCGDVAVKASNNKLKHGMHRVIYPTINNKPRLTMWFEICTSSQDPSSNLSRQNFPFNFSKSLP